MVLHGQLDTVPCTQPHVIPGSQQGLPSAVPRWPTDAAVSGWVGPLVQLQLGLDVLSGEGDADLDPSCDAT